MILDPHKEFAESLRREADRIVNLILHSELAWIDIQIEVARLKNLVCDCSPDDLELFEIVYESRFQRIWDQWRVPVSQPWS
jgi:hypothetical protein